MRTPAAPAAPDPRATASAQSAMNRDTAITQQYVNATDQYTPDGSLVYSQGQPITQTLDDGREVTINRLVATQSLSPTQQAIKALTDQTEQNVARIGRDQSSRIGELLSEPVKMGNEATEARLMELGSKRLDPKFAQAEDAMRSSLANRGIRAGTAQFDAEMRNFNEGRNDAYNSLLLNGRAQANQEMLAERNQPINEIGALLSQGQVSQPQFTNTPQSNVAGVDYAGMVRDKYNADRANWQSKVSQNNAMMGGLFQLGGAAASAFMYSDARLKTDIKKVGKTDDGLGVYAYRYKAGGPMQIGLMAQEVAEKKPGAVAAIDGFLAVDYGKATA